jgi:cell division protein FtsB
VDTREIERMKAEHEQTRRTFIKAEWISAVVTVLVALCASVSGYAVLHYKTDDNTVQIETLRIEEAKRDSRISVLEQHVSDMQAQLNRIEDNSRVAIGLPPRSR